MSATSRYLGTQSAKSETKNTDTIRVNWDEFEREFAEWGRKLDELSARAKPANAELLRNLKQLHADLQEKAGLLRTQTEKLGEDSDLISPEMRKRMAEAKDSALETVKDTGTKVGKGAQDLQDGFVRAWKEMRSAFDSAAQHFKENQAEPGGESTQSDPASGMERRGDR